MKNVAKKLIKLLYNCFNAKKKIKIKKIKKKCRRKKNWTTNKYAAFFFALFFFSSHSLSLLLSPRLCLRFLPSSSSSYPLASDPSASNFHCLPSVSSVSFSLPLQFPPPFCMHTQTQIHYFFRYIFLSTFFFVSF